MKNTSAYSKVKEWILDVAVNQTSEVTSIPSERQLGNMLNVSRDTVRRAISSLVDEGILDSRQGMGTFINRKTISSHRKRNWAGTAVGIILFSGRTHFEIKNYPWVIMQGAINELCAKGIKAQLINIESSGVLAAKEIISHEISGIIWISPSEDCRGIIDYLQEHDTPVMTVGGSLKDMKKIHNIATDDAAGGFMGGEYLLSKGHNRILFASLSENRIFDCLRFNGFINALAKYGCQPLPELVVKELDILDVYQAVRRIIKNGPEFTAIFCADGIFLRSIYNAVRDEGKNIPNDYSLITYDKSPAAECPGIQLVEICQPLEELGRAAVKNISGIISGRQQAFVKEVFRPKISDGNSCMPIKWVQDIAVQ